MRIPVLSMGLPMWLSILVALAPAVGVSDESGVAEIVHSSIRHIELNGREMSGPGADWLVRRAASAQFFLFAEQHATREIARSAEALYQSLAPMGYSVAVIEVGPWSTPRLEALLRADGPDSWQSFMAEPANHLVFPFFFFTEEADFGRAVVELSPARPALWGLDQEFIAAGPLLLHQLKKMADEPEEVEALERVAAALVEDPMALGSGPDAPWDQLGAAFADPDDAGALVRDMLLSRRIYAPFTGRGGNRLEANTLRENLMKSNLMARLDEADGSSGGWPKAFFKFGAGHLAYGHSPTHVLSLGTFVAELARSRELDVFSLHVDCIGGQARDPRSGGEVPCRSYYLDGDSVLRRFVSGDQPTLIDLAAIRPHEKAWRDWDERSRSLLRAFDAYLAIPNVHAAALH